MVREPGARLPDLTKSKGEDRYRSGCVRSESGAKTPMDPGVRFRKRVTQASSPQSRRRAHRGVRAPGADLRRRLHRKETRRERRQAFRRSRSESPHELRLATLLAQNSSNAKSTDKNSSDIHSKPIVVRPKYSAAKIQPCSTMFFVHFNIEGIRVIGRLHELCTLMTARRWKLAILSEAKCNGSSFFQMWWVLGASVR